MSIDRLVRVRDAGQFKFVKNVRIFTGGAWKVVKQIWVKDGGSWRLAHEDGAIAQYPVSGDFGDFGSGPEARWVDIPNLAVAHNGAFVQRIGIFTTYERGPNNEPTGRIENYGAYVLYYTRPVNDNIRVGNKTATGTYSEVGMSRNPIQQNILTNTTNVIPPAPTTNPFTQFVRAYGTTDIYRLINP